MLRVSPSSTATFTDEYLSRPEPHLCRDLVLTIYEESHQERRMSGNPSWNSNFGLGGGGVFSVEAANDQERL